MNKKYIAYAVLGMVLIGTIATLSISMVAAQGDVEVGGDHAQVKLQAQTQATYQFQHRTRIRINTSADADINMDCDAMNIGDKTFSIDIDSDNEYQMNMTCKRDQDQLGVQNGSLVRNQYRHQVRNGFAVQIECNESVQARLGMEMSRGDAIRASWAYFDEPTEEWVEVQSSYEDGMLVAETDHFSVWTIVDSPSLTLLWVGIGVGVVAIGAIAAILIRKKRA
jgi:hypothetical protein